MQGWYALQTDWCQNIAMMDSEIKRYHEYHTMKPFDTSQHNTAEY